MVAEIQNYYTMIFLYDGMGQPIGMLYKSTGSSTGEWQIFWYEKNLQGDVVAVYDNNGVKHVSYTYDAWGNFTTTTHVSGTAATYNPIRYRSYYYDREINLYYLGARWYSPRFHRFMSPDDISYLGANGDPNSYNLYAYCSNNPVNMIDPTGHLAITTIAVIVGAVIGFVISSISSVATQLEEHDGDWSEIDLLEAAFDGVFGAINGSLAASGINIWWSMGLGAVLGFASSVGKDCIFNNQQIDWCVAVNSFFIGGVAGAIAGAGANSIKGSMQVTKFVNSRDILNRTIANGTKRAIAGQTHAMNVHAIQLLISGIRYMLSNTFSSTYTMLTN